MRQSIIPTIICAASICMAGCANHLTPDSHAAATKQWNDARASVLSNLAADQFKDGNFEKCQQTIDQALKLQPDNPALHLLAAKLAIEQGQAEVADAHLASARRLDPKNAEADYLAGVLFQRWHQLDKARDAYADAVNKAPEEQSYVLAEAEMLVALHNTADALALLKSKLPAFEHSGVIRDEIGQLLVQQKQFADAIVFLREASILSANDLTVREHLAFALFDDKQFAESADLFRRLTSETEYQKRADVHAALGECEARAQQFSEARESFTAATKLAPKLAEYWLSLSKVDAQLVDFAAAELAARKATSLDPASGEALCLLGYVRLKLNHLAESQTAFRAASNLDPHDSVSLSMQGYVAARMGHADEARAFYARALQINPKDAIANRFTQVASAAD